MTTADLWNTLKSAGLTTVDEPPVAALESPWYIRVMLGFAGWIAALFLLAFVAVGLSWIIENSVASLVLAILFMAAAWWIYRYRSENEFIEQMALVFSLAGQGLWAVAFFDFLHADSRASAFWLAFAMLQTVLALIMSNPIHRGWSGFAAIASLYFAVNNTAIEPIVSAAVLGLAAWLWLGELRHIKKAQILRPVAYGVVAALVTMDLASGLFRGASGFAAGASAAPQYAWLGQMLSGAVLMAVCAHLLRREGLQWSDRLSLIVLGGSLVLVAVSTQAPGICIGVTILLLGFAQGNHLLSGFGILALLVYAGGYYYRLDATLLVKSASLALTGAVLLLVRWGVVRHV